MNQMARPPLPTMTADAFLAWPGDDSGRKSHLIDGNVWSMPPASRVHGAIRANLADLMGAATRAARTRLQVVTKGATIPAVTVGDNVRVPDLVVGPIGRDIADRIVGNPVVVVEVLSPGNKAITRDNVRAYATLSSVQEIVVVHTSRMELEPSHRLTFTGIALDCPKEDVYADTGFTRD